VPAALGDFRVRLGLVAGAALAVRVAWVLAWARDQGLHGDQVFYHVQGRALAAGVGFVNPYAWNDTANQVEIPTAAHPPLYSMYLGTVSLLGGESELTHRLASTLLGVLCVVLVGLVARRLAGDRAGLLAAAVAAVYPNLWINDGLLAAEAIYAPAIAAVLLTAYRFWDEPGVGRAAGLGLAVAVAALARAEAASLFVFLVIPLILVLRSVDWRRRAGLLVVTGAVGVAALSPWIIRNWVQMGQPGMSTGTGYVLEIANCDESYRGPMLGYWSVECDRAHTWVNQPEIDDGMSEVERADAIRQAALANAEQEVQNERSKRAEGLDYLRDHLDRLPVVVAARVGRMWEVYRPSQGVDLNVFFERRGRLPSQAALGMYYVLVPFAIGGLAVLWRRKVTIVPFVALAVMATVTAAASFGITRYRVGADVGLTVLAGIALDALWRWWRRRSASSDEQRSEAGDHGTEAAPRQAIETGSMA
jgi:4-amino-4-deoxy-L-arabinose transferase-like glycosyltransferase